LASAIPLCKPGIATTSAGRQQLVPLSAEVIPGRIDSSEVRWLDWTDVSILYSSDPGKTFTPQRSGTRFRLWDDAPDNVSGVRRRCRGGIPRIFLSTRAQRKVAGLALFPGNPPRFFPAAN